MNNLMASALSVLMLLPLSAEAVTIGGLFDRLFGPVGSVDFSPTDMSDELNRLAGLNQRSLLNSEWWRKSQSQSNEYASCVKQYEDFYADGVMDISLTAGYLDWPEAGRNLDQDSIEMVYGALTQDCGSSKSQACGFQEVNRLSPSKLVLERSIPGLYEIAPDAVLGESSKLRAKDLKVRVTLAHSAWSRYDKDNFSSGVIRAEQKSTSELAERTFFGGIGEKQAGIPLCDVCAYLGHARNGGGPDFRPVPLLWRDKKGEPKYEKYLATRANFRRLMRAMEASEGKTRQMIAIMGCNSEGNFYHQAKKACLVQGAPNCKPKTLKDYEGRFGLVLTNKLSWPQNQYKYLSILFDGLLQMKCKSAWTSNYKVLESIKKYPEEYRVIGNFL